MKIKSKIFLTIVMLFTLIPAGAFASENDVTATKDFDQILLKNGTPLEIVKEMDNDLKQMIYQNSGTDFTYVNVTEDESTVRPFASSGYEIPKSDLNISVVAFKVSGQSKVDIYPSYEWKKAVKPRGKDYFGYSTHDSFSVVPNKRSNLIHYKLNASDNWTTGDPATYTSSSLTGYEHKGSTLGTPDFPIYIKGNFYFQADIDGSSPVKKIAISYVHDTSSGGSYSYGIGFGPASISVTPNSSNVGYNTNVYTLSY
ncbi:hypothetical protein [Paenibacillus tuaregi]|uniref:hypothetical protein n=1 Tax=Paenibacillus tuaregi TaxID=1816681 RepID=UPI0008399BA4|nr:hypothetical protein [Paenibacillus tuaregi]